jgi:hypothetical protein
MLFADPAERSAYDTPRETIDGVSPASLNVALVDEDVFRMRRLHRPVLDVPDLRARLALPVAVGVFARGQVGERTPIVFVFHSDSGGRQTTRTSHPFRVRTRFQRGPGPAGFTFQFLFVFLAATSHTSDSAVPETRRVSRPD